MKNPNVTLQSTKFVGGLFINKFTSVSTEDEATYSEDHIRSSTKTPHPDYINGLQELKPFLARVHGFNAVEILRNAKELTADEKKAFKVVKEKLDALNETALDGINITGISLSGKADMRQLVITGTNTTGSGKKVAINSENISLNGTTYGFEEDLQKAVDVVEDEVHQFLFQNKKAQPEIPFQKEGEEQPAGKTGS